MKNNLLLLGILFFSASLFGQVYSYNKSKPFIIHKVNQPVKVDGILDEAIWAKLRDNIIEHEFVQYFPYDTSKAITKTEFELAHDDKFIYAAFVCQNRNVKKPFVIQSLKRDFSVNTNDAVVLSISPFLDGQNGFSFGVTPFNAQREGAIENGGNMGVTTAWDQVWVSQTKISDSFWVAEIAIPLSSIRFIKGSKVWSFNVARIDLKNNEISSYKRVPRNYNVSSLVFADSMIWENPIIEKSKNLAIIPYVSSISESKGPGQAFSTKPKFGGDAKIGITSSLNLDITVNPDFANVDVDVQQLNLTRYSLYFPERRQFFIENSDLFANFGFRQIRPFFSRRIGLNSTVGNVPILYGVRLSGKYGNGLRLGAMNLTTARFNESIAPINYTVLAFQKKVFQASNFGMILVNDQVLNSNKKVDYNTVAGLEFNLLTKSNIWSGKAFVQKSFYPGIGNHGYAHATWLLYKTLKWFVMWNHEYVSKSFVARTGFVPRTDNYNLITGKTVKYDYWRLEPQIKRVFYPKGSLKKIINNYGLSIYNSSYYDSSFNPTESYTENSIEFNFQNSTYLQISYEKEYYRLFLPFAPVNLPDTGYFKGKYHWDNLHIEFNSNTRKSLSCSTEYIRGGYFDGRKTEYIAAVSYRLPGMGKRKLPKWFVTANIRHVDIQVRDSLNYKIDLIGFKADYTLTTTTYLTGYWQLNAQNKLMNVNIRFQWRYRPMCDLFVVFSQNWNQVYLVPTARTEVWDAKGRNLAAKIVYWF